MSELLQLGLANLLSPMILAFALGAVAATIRSDLEIPETLAKGMAIYLMFAIGFKGGVAMAANAQLAAAAAVGLAVVLSFAMPVLAFTLLRIATPIERVDAAAVAAHYGSISIVTFVAASQFLDLRSVAYEGYLVAMMAAMETPAIVTGIFLARGRITAAPGQQSRPHLLREVLANGSVVLLVGGFMIGWATSDGGMAKLRPFVQDIFNGILCLFLMDLGLLTVRQLRQAPKLAPSLILFGLYMPLLGALVGLGAARALGLSLGGSVLFTVLTASASYIAVPAAIRLALPEAKASICVALALGVTFPFNVVLGIPLYYAAAQWLSAL